MSLMSERDLADRLAERGVLRVRLQVRVDGLLERVRALSPQAAWFGDELVVPDPRPCVRQHSMSSAPRAVRSPG